MPDLMTYTQLFTHHGHLEIQGTLHQLGTMPVLVKVYTDDVPPKEITDFMLDIDPQTYDVVVTFGYMQLDMTTGGSYFVHLPPQSGRVILYAPATPHP
jgi:hypothetical protein